MLIIFLKNGSHDYYESKDYTEYRRTATSLIVLKGEKWIGEYNFDNVSYWRVFDEDDKRIYDLI